MRQDTVAGMMVSGGALGGICDGSGPGTGGEDRGLGGRGNWLAPGATTGGGTSAWAGFRGGGPNGCVRSMVGGIGTVACV